MRKLALTTAGTLFAVMLLLSNVHAWTVGVTPNPTSVSPGGAVTITVSSDLTATGSITVTDPHGVSTTAAITVTGGSSVSKDYPTDFGLLASSSSAGHYTVSVTLVTSPGSGEETFTSFFQVSFLVIPEYPIGAILGVILPLAALVLYTKVKTPLNN